MHDLQVTPAGLQVFSNQSPVAMFRSRLTAEKASTINEIFRNLFLNLSPSHQVHELLFIASPVPPVFLIFVEKFFGWREVRPMNIVNAVDLTKKKAQIIFLRKPCELRHIVQASINKPYQAWLFEAREELFSVLLCKPDGKYLQFLAPSRLAVLPAALPHPDKRSALRESDMHR